MWVSDVTLHPKPRCTSQTLPILGISSSLGPKVRRLARIGAQSVARKPSTTNLRPEDRYAYDDGTGLMTCTAGATYTMTVYCPSPYPAPPSGTRTEGLGFRQGTYIVQAVVEGGVEGVDG